MPSGDPSSSRAEEGGCGIYLFLGLVAAVFLTWWGHGFVPSKLLAGLVILGSMFFMVGVSLVVEGKWWVPLVGAVLVLLSAYALLPRAPRDILFKVPLGSWFLEARDVQLVDLEREERFEQMGRVAELGVGEAWPRDTFQNPLLHSVEDPEILAALLAGGLDANIRDKEGQTLLSKTRDPEVARVLLAAWARPDLADNKGRTPLMYAARKDPELIEVLLAAGASRDARDDSGRRAVDFLMPDDQALRPLLEPPPVEETDAEPIPEAVPPGQWRRDWLVVTEDPEAELPDTSIRTGRPAYRFGDRVRVEIVFSNPTAEPKGLRVEARIGTGGLLVDASHGGRAVVPKAVIPIREIRWPPLALPEHSAGRLTLDLLIRADSDGGDLRLDVMADDLESPRKREALQLYVGPSDPPGSRSGLADLLGALAFPAVVLAFAFALGSFLASFQKAPDDPRRVRLARGGAFGLAVILGLGSYGLITEETRLDQQVETTCTILDLRLDSDRLPFLAVDYETPQGEEIVTSGYGFRKGLRIGDEVPCWVSPEHPRRFRTQPRASFTVWKAFAWVTGFFALAALAWLVRSLVRGNAQDSVT